ncbi:MAG TPA: glycosyltransferase [Frankiaceae bacterium]|jgi:GT2 family glycosyltransferase|nr:glycosyltransferase [Frankiaceae bacterium]
MGTEALTVVIPTRDRPEWLSRSLAALASQAEALGGVIVVDSASRSAEVAQVARAFGAHYLREDVPGASRARNRGWREARTDYVVFLDDDLLVRPGWAPALAAAASEREVAFVTGRVALPEGASDPTGFALIDHGAARVLDAQTRGVLGGTANLLVSRRALAAVGGFDERLGPGRWLSAGEDLDLLDRLVEAGMTGWYEPAAVVECEQWREGSARTKLAWAYGKGMGARFAAMARRSPRRALARWNELLRLGGLATALHRRPSADAPTAAPTPGPGWSEPVCWRLGALVGFFAALPLRRWAGSKQ